jgi:hypothetical protein
MGPTRLSSETSRQPQLHCVLGFQGPTKQPGHDCALLGGMVEPGSFRIWSSLSQQDGCPRPG